MISANELFVKGDKFHCRVCGTELIFIDVDNKPVTLLDGAKDNYSNKVTNDNANIFFFELHIVKCCLCKTCRKCRDILWINDTPDILYHKEVLHSCNPYAP